jgi:hypothetical protein
MPSKREWVLLAAVPALVLMGAFADHGKGSDPSGAAADASPASGAGARAHPRRQGSSSELNLAMLHRKAELQKPEDLFVTRSWYVAPPPPPPVEAAPPAPPTAPPLPFTFLGRYWQSGKLTFFLVSGDRVLSVKQGDIVDGNYRIDGVSGATLLITYLPLNSKQSLDMGTAG